MKDVLKTPPYNLQDLQAHNIRQVVYIIVDVSKHGP